MTGIPSPQTLLAKRTVEKLRNTLLPSAAPYEPDWNMAMIQRVLGALGEVILDAVSHGEEVQLGRLGSFFPKVFDERIVASNLQGGEKKVIPKRIHLGFDATTSAETRVQEFSKFLNEFDKRKTS